MMLMIYALLFTFVFCSDEIPEHCEKFESAVPISYEDVKECLYHIPFKEGVRGQTLESIEELAELYIYKDTATKPMPPFDDIQVDLRSELKKLRTKKYEKDYEFQIDVQRIYSQLKDPHTRYVPPFCYSSYISTLPFTSTSRLEIDETTNEKVQKVFIKRHFSEYVRTNYSLIYPSKEHYVYSYLDWEIVEIEGIPGFDFLLKEAEKSSFSRDLSTRFNHILSNFFFNKLMLNPLHEKSSIEMKVRDLNNAEHVETINPSFMVYPLISTSEHVSFEMMCGYKYFLKFNFSRMDIDQEVSSKGDEEVVVAENRITGSVSELLDEILPHTKNNDNDNEEEEDIFFFENIIREMMTEGIDETASFSSLLSGNMYGGTLTLPLIDSMINERFTTIGSRKPFEIRYDEMTDHVITNLGHLLPDDFDVTTTPFYTPQQPSKRTGRRNGEELDLEEEDLFHKLGEAFGITTFIRRRMNETQITGIMQVSTFYPTDKSPVYWALQVYVSLEMFKQLKVSRVVIDLRGNGGGYLCLPWLLIKMLSPYSPKSFYITTDTLANEYYQKSYCPEQYKLEYYGMLDETGDGMVDTTFWTEPVERARGEETRTSNYSKPVTLDCKVFEFLFLEGFLKNDKDGKKINLDSPAMKFEPNQIVLLTDGTCGSACGIFVTTMKRLGLARVVGQGGLYHLEEGQTDDEQEPSETKEEEESTSSTSDFLAICSFRGAAVTKAAISYYGAAIKTPFILGMLIGDFFLVRFVKLIVGVITGFLLLTTMCAMDKPCPCVSITRLPGLQMHTYSWLEIYDFDKYGFFDYPSEYERVIGIGKSNDDDDDDNNNIDGSSVLLGYNKDRADARLWNWDFGKKNDDEVKVVYDLTLTKGFDEGCFDWEIKRVDECVVDDAVENGVYGYPCGKEDREFEERENDACVLRGCRPGYYLTRDHSECRVMKEQSLTQLGMFDVIVSMSLTVRVVWLFVFCFCLVCYCCSFSFCGWCFFCCFANQVKRNYDHENKEELRFQPRHLDLLSIESSEVSSFLSTTTTEDENTTTETSDDDEEALIGNYNNTTTEEEEDEED